MKKVRYGVVGLGYIAQAAVLPSFKHAKSNSELVALISDSPDKIKKLSKKYKTSINIPYTGYEALLRSGEIDAVYIALPNHLHAEYSIKAAEAGVHILCEKPMAVTVQECERMMEVAKENSVKFMTAYRLHFERANLKAIELIKKGKIGTPKYFESTFSMQLKQNNIRSNPISQGGGTLYDIGIYCLNAARYLFQSEPIEVFAMSSSTGDKRFKEIDETTIVSLRFPDNRLASFVTSFGSADEARYKVVGSKGSLEVENAYEWANSLTHSLKIGERKTKTKYPKRDQFAPEIVYFSDCILKNKPVEPSAEEGLRDVRVIEALYESAGSGRSLTLEQPESKLRPSLTQEIRRPALPKELHLVKVGSPHT